ncbi:hypothetical protein DPV73_17495 [Leptospira mayottensis]|nr:hypothetical protein DPV73_17495 [Leptospira mayottensis]
MVGIQFSTTPCLLEIQHRYGFEIFNLTTRFKAIFFEEYNYERTHQNMNGRIAFQVFTQKPRKTNRSFEFS